MSIIFTNDEGLVKTAKSIIVNGVTVEFPYLCINFSQIVQIAFNRNELLEDRQLTCTYRYKCGQCGTMLWDDYAIEVYDGLIINICDTSRA